MTSIARVIHNFDKGSCNSVIITYEGEVIWDGHQFPNNPEMFIEVAKYFGDADIISESSLDDEQILKWKDVCND